MMRCVVRTAVALLAGAVALYGCASDCNERGCQTELVLMLPDSIGEGAWRLEIDADGEHITCTFDVPMAPGPTGCRENLWLLEGETPGLLFQWAPKTVRVEAFRDGVLAISAQVQPTYETVAPNGFDCGPVCEVASVQIEPSE